MEPQETLPPEKVAFIAYNIGVFESVQKFGNMVTSGKVSAGMEVSKVAELLAESMAFYDSEMISQIINAMLLQQPNGVVGRVTASQVDYVMRQLKATGISLPR